MIIYLVKSESPKFRYFFTDAEKANLLYLILKERYHNRAVIQFKTIEAADSRDLADIMDNILITEFDEETDN